MNNLWERIQNLAKLQYEISRGDADAVAELKELYRAALDKTMKRDCLNCRIRAFHELTNLTQEKIQVMKDQKYTFKDPETLVYFDHQHFTKANLTDDVALAMVKSNAGNADLFNGSFPDGKEEKPKKTKEEKAIEVPAETVIDPAKSE